MERLDPPLRGILGGGSRPPDPLGPTTPPGPPGESGQDLEPNTRGNAANSPGSPFNELGINSVNGDIGGQHYSPKSRYDVACFQQAQHNPR